MLWYAQVSGKHLTYTSDHCEPVTVHVVYLCLYMSGSIMHKCTSTKNAKASRENSSSHSDTNWHLHTQYKETNYKPCHFFFINLSHIFSKKLPMNSSSCLGLPFFSICLFCIFHI